MLLLSLLNACSTTCELYEPSFLIGKKKQDYVENIMRRVNSVHAAQASALSQTQPLVVEKLFLADPSPIHQFYGKYFNLVDLADSYYWHKVQESNKNYSWKSSKLLLGNMRFAMLNAWVVMASQVKYEEWLTFRANLATEVKTYGI